MAYVPIVPYADSTYADAYFGERLDTDTWDATSAPEKIKALKQATRIIDLLPLVSEKYDETQVREFPRAVDGTDVPVEVQDACCEAALAALEGITAATLVSSTGIAAESTGDASVSYTGDRGDLAVLDETYGLGSLTAAQLLAPWIVDPSEIDITRV
jgi:hypothetical protein